MFGKNKDNSPATEQAAAPMLAADVAAAKSPAAAPDSPDQISSISSGMTIVGRISGEGAVKIFGRVEGELHGLVCSGKMTLDAARILILNSWEQIAKAPPIHQTRGK